MLMGKQDGKQKVSVTLSPSRISAARRLTGNANLSDLLDEALAALIEREQERRWIEGRSVSDGDPIGDVVPDLTDAPWNDEG